MKPSSLTNIRYQGNFKDPRARGRRVLGIVAGVLTASGAVYALFFTPLLEINAIELSGFERSNQAQVQEVLWNMINERHAGFQPYRDIFLFNTNAASDRLGTLFPSIRNITIEKQYPHTLKVFGAERTPIGIWCAGESCTYYDENKAWGRALKSSGALLTVIEDERSGDAIIEPEFITLARTVVQRLPQLGIAHKRLVIPKDAPVEFRVYAGKPYFLRFALDGSIEGQLETLRVFLEEKEADPAFNPQTYIDLRIQGRVYFK